MSESDVLRSICDYLAYKKLFFWRNNNLPVYDSTHKIFRAMPKYSMLGVPDIIIVKDGQFIGLEVKQKGTYQSKHQKEFERKCKEAGGKYFVVRSIDDLKLKELEV